MLPPAATEFYALQQRVNFETRRQVRRLWSTMGPDFEGSWRQIRPQLFMIITTGQLTVADEVEGYLRDLAEQTTAPAVEGELAPESVVGYASDGRDLESLTYQAVVKTGEAYNAGASTAQALSIGGNWLTLATALQVADAARVATSIGAAARPDWGGYVRYLNPPSCGRCAILAGRFYRWSEGFLRHPRCDCINVPSRNQGWAEAEGFIGNPDEAWRQGHVKDLTKVQRQALEDGADFAQLINSRRGMSMTTDIKGVRFDFTLEGTTRRGLYGKTGPAARSMEKGPGETYLRTTKSRLTPETINRVASDRAHAIRLLRHYGYIR